VMNRREHWTYVGVCTVWGIDYYYWVHPILGKHRREVATYRRETLTSFH
jgi:hypothetical protein